MAQSIYWKKALAGGADASIDSIDITLDSLVDGDCCIVLDSVYGLCSYVYDDDSGETAAVPTYIAPDLDNGLAYSGDGRWVLQNIVGAKLVLNGGHLLLDPGAGSGFQASTNNIIKVLINGQEDFEIIANVFKVLSGSQLSIESGASLDMNGEEFYLDADGDSYLLADVDDIVQMIIGGVDYGNLKPPPTFVNETNGKPVYSATTLVASTVLVEGSWESVGPTGGGANNTWAALDEIPTVADWIEVQVIIAGESGVAETNLLSRLFARKNGSSSAADTDTAIGYAGVLSDADGEAYITTATSAKIPLSTSNLFDLNFSSTFTTDSITLKLTGWGYNSN